MIYLFHNIYGDADELIATKPVDCEVIPFGWTPEIEEYRNNKLQELGVSVSGLPAVVYWQPTFTVTLINSDTQESKDVVTLDSWQVVWVYKMDQPWTWEAIQAEIDRDKNTTHIVAGD
jgi:hypothetical protein